MINDLEKKIFNVKQSSRNLSLLSAQQRVSAIELLSSKLLSNKHLIIKVNEDELTSASQKGLGNHILDRMKITEETIDRMVESLNIVKELPDSVSEIISSKVRDNGLMVNKVRVPLGVLGVIFESRPNVVIEIASLAIKSGNALIMRGGSDCLKTNLFLFNLVKESLDESGFPENSMYFLDYTDRKAVSLLLSMDKYIDLLIPRGSSSLVNLVNQNAKMPSITGGVGVCHTYIDDKADFDQAINIIDNAKTQNPSVCNALDTVIIHENILDQIIVPLTKALLLKNVKIKADKKSYENIKNFSGVELASLEDFGEEFLDLKLSIKTVNNLEEAIDHISDYGSKHSEAIITNDINNAKYFLEKVDSAAVFHNTSTRFNDGYELGLGAEVAVSTDKLHARGPMGINDLMTYKWVVSGNGQLRS
ncbi:MAG: glutamate-5-semialdehyde dehydrogenase [Dehalococcoidales bacterium]|jgi:glutamate-5-semialdehyde dehydrogenase|nr:glutamate-5-semialdehyde dehydrogenase [Dehalococcoidales bacterium]